MAGAARNYQPRQDILDKFPEISGNTVNGLGESEWRAPPPFFWHPPDRQTHGELQQFIVAQFRPNSMEDRSFRNPAVDRGPDLVAVATTRQEASAEQWTEMIKDFVLADEADLVGITPVTPENVYEGYEIAEPTLVMIVTVFYIYAVFQVGFYAASFVFYFLVTYMTGIRNHKVMAAVALVLFPLMFVFFNIAIQIP